MVRIFSFCFLLVVGMHLFGQNRRCKSKSDNPFFNVTGNTFIDISSDFIGLKKPCEFLTDKDINVTLFDGSEGERIEDTILLREIFKTLPILVPSKKSLIDEKTEVYYMGDIPLQPSINSKIIFLILKDEKQERHIHKVVIGLNVNEERVVSVIKLSEKLELMGFGSLCYSQYNKGVFKLITTLPSDLTGKIKRKQGKARRIRMRNNGELH